MKKYARYLYYVEGEDEKKLIDVLKTDFQLIHPGKSQVFNVTTCRLTNLRLMNITGNTCVVLVFDTDTDHTAILKENIQRLRSCSNVAQVLCVPQVRNLEDELLRACTVKSIRGLTKSNTDSSFKRDWINCTNAKERLLACSFDPKRLWTKRALVPFEEFPNDSGAVWK